MISSNMPSIVSTGSNATEENFDGAKLLERARRLVIRDIALLIVSVVLIVLGTAQRGSPFVLKQACAWFYGVSQSNCSNLGAETTQNGTLFFLGIVAVYSGLFIYMRAWLSLSKLVQKLPEHFTGMFIVAFITLVLLLLFAPPLFSRDAYSYAGQGEMVSRGISPYQYGVSVLGPYSSNPYINQVDPLWKNTPVPYGPLDLELSAFLVDLSMHKELVSVLLLRIVMCVGGVLVAILYLPRFTRLLNIKFNHAFVLAILNPIVVLHLIGGIHNDALMLGLLLPALCYALEERYFISLVLVALAAEVKIPAVIALGFIGWKWAGENSSFLERAKTTFFAGVTVFLVMEVVGLISGLGWGFLFTLSAPDTVVSWLSPSTGLGILLSHVASAFHFSIFSSSSILHGTRNLGELVGAGVIVYLCLNSFKFGFVNSLGAALICIVLFAPVVQPWYLAWGISILIIVCTEHVRNWLCAFSVAGSFVGLPGGHILLRALEHTNIVVLIPYLIIMAAVLLGPSLFNLKYSFPKFVAAFKRSWRFLNHRNSQIG